MKPDFYKNILDNLFDGVYFVDLDRKITYWNRGAERISGYSADDVIGHCCATNILKHINADGLELCTQGCPLKQTLDDSKQREAHVFLHHKDGHRVPVAMRIFPLHNDDGAVIGAVEVFTDASNQLRIMNELKELKTQTLTDQLTGLGNRAAVEQEFKRRIIELRHYGTRFALLFIDVDHFKDVNDTYGHDTGDTVLALVAKTLKSALRSVDTLCRWGGEEFVALVPKVNEEVFRSVAERMRRFIEVSPLPLNGGKLSITVSVGGAMARPDDSLASLAARADAMMYQAKRTGRNCTSLDCGCVGTG
ncbi:MAG: diguanylate cyclase [Desulfovibrio sp.]